MARFLSSVPILTIPIVGFWYTAQQSKEEQWVYIKSRWGSMVTSQTLRCLWAHWEYKWFLSVLFFGGGRCLLTSEIVLHLYLMSFEFLQFLLKRKLCHLSCVLLCPPESLVVPKHQNSTYEWITESLAEVGGVGSAAAATAAAAAGAWPLSVSTWRPTKSTGPCRQSPSLPILPKSSWCVDVRHMKSRTVHNTTWVLFVLFLTF